MPSTWLNTWHRVGVQVFAEWLNKWSHSLAPPNLSLLLCYLNSWHLYRSNCTHQIAPFTLADSQSHVPSTPLVNFSPPSLFPSLELLCMFPPGLRSFTVHLAASSSLSSTHPSKLLPLSFYNHLMISPIWLMLFNEFPIFYSIKETFFSPRRSSLTQAQTTFWCSPRPSPCEMTHYSAYVPHLCLNSSNSPSLGHSPASTGRSNPPPPLRQNMPNLKITLFLKKSFQVTLMVLTSVVPITS